MSYWNWSVNRWEQAEFRGEAIPASWPIGEYDNGEESEVSSVFETPSYAEHMRTRDQEAAAVSKRHQLSLGAHQTTRSRNASG